MMDHRLSQLIRAMHMLARQRDDTRSLAARVQIKSYVQPRIDDLRKLLASVHSAIQADVAKEGDFYKELLGYVEGALDDLDGLLETRLPPAE